MAQQNSLMRFGNLFMALILSSPLHGLISRSFMLITVTGRKSGKTYTTPVNYERQGDCLTVISERERTWWRNLRGGSTVTLRLQGKLVKGQGVVIDDDAGVAASLSAYMQQMPQAARYMGLTLDARGRPNREEVARVAHSKVIVQLQVEPLH